MSTPILTTKLYIPPPRPRAVFRHRLITRLNEGLHQKLTLMSAPAGFGKTTLASEWVTHCERPVAWLSLDEEHNDPGRFLIYLVAALQTIVPTIGEGILVSLQSPQPPSPESVLTTLLNEIATIPNPFILILDDYHRVDAKPVDLALAFLVEHLPPPMHLAITTREDPPLPLARLRVQNHLAELRADDLRFTPEETAVFLNQAMGLNLSAKDVAALENRTEGWIAGLQLAALALQGAVSAQNQPDPARFIQTFTGSHRFVLDYLLEEVLQQQPESIQTFLLHTSVLERMCGSLCESVLPDHPTSGEETLAYLEQANLFLIPLDNERRWYRYHHLFGDLLRQRLQQRGLKLVRTAQIRASQWYEENELELEAFHYAVAAEDIERATRLLEGKGMPLHFRGAVTPVLNWLSSLPTAVLDDNPFLWVMYASALSMAGRVSEIEPRLKAAEAALEGLALDAKTRNLIGHIAAIRALVAAVQYQVDEIITQSERALQYLHPDNLPVRTATIWKLGFAHQLQGNRVAASQAYHEAMAISQASGNMIIYLSATTGLGQVQESENELHLAAQTYQKAVQMVGDLPASTAGEAHLGLARINYEWNDLDAARFHCQQSIQLARQIENSDRFVACEIFEARLQMALGNVAATAVRLANIDQVVRQRHFAFQIPDLVATQVLLALKQGELATAVQLVQTHDVPLSQARVCIAQGDTEKALAVLAVLQEQAVAKNWADERLKVMVLQALAYQAKGDLATAVNQLQEALALAESGGFIRLFVDEGQPIRDLLLRMKADGSGRSEYIQKLLAAFEKDEAFRTDLNVPSAAQLLTDPLSERELEVLQLIAQGLSNREIGERLFLALDTVKGHNRNIFSKLDVQRRTEAVAQARELGLL